MPVSLGLGLPQTKQYDLGRDVADVARAAEETGYESLWVFERVQVPEPATQGRAADRVRRGPGPRPGRVRGRTDGHRPFRRGPPSRSAPSRCTSPRTARAPPAAGIPEFLLDLQGTTRDGAELIDVVAEVYAAARAAGI